MHISYLVSTASLMFTLSHSGFDCNAFLGLQKCFLDKWGLWVYHCKMRWIRWKIPFLWTMP